MSEKIKRYDIQTEWGHGFMEGANDGDYVRYNDVIALQAKVTELEAAARWIPIIRDLPVLGVPVDIWVRGKRLADWYLDHFSQTDHSLHWYSGMSNLFDGPESIPLADVDGWMPLPQPPSNEGQE